jgi:hypothetical protein
MPAPDVIIQGTPSQQDILREGWNKLRFPWDKLTRYPQLVIGWDDLNDGSLAPGAEAKLNPGHGHAEPEDAQAPPHVHVEDPKYGTGHAVSRKEQGRWRIAGVFWTNGRIYIDNYYEAHPQAAQAILSAEAAHFVDYGLPYTAAHKEAIMKLFHPGGGDTHTWWERNSYSGEYFTLLGEANMDLWTFAYSDFAPGAWPTHPSTEQMGDELRKILGIPRTDEGGSPAPPLRLSARGWVTTFGNGRAKLEWTGAQGPKVTVWRNDARLMTTLNDGSFLNNLASKRGTFRYQIKDGQGRSSNVAVVQI